MPPIHNHFKLIKNDDRRLIMYFYHCMFNLYRTGSLILDFGDLTNFIVLQRREISTEHTAVKRACDKLSTVTDGQRGATTSRYITRSMPRQRQLSENFYGN